MGNNILSPNQFKLLEFSSKERSIANNFFLTGGTALVYFYFKHRFSEDLDFFSESELNISSILGWVKRASKDVKSARVEQQSLSSQEIFYFYFPDNSFVKIDFAYFPFEHIGEFKKFNSLKISSIEDITLNKLQAIITRKRSRDYLDLYYCLKELNWSIEQLKRNYQLKFGITLGLEQIVTSFANVVDSYDLPRFLGNSNWKEVERFFLEVSAKFKAALLSK